MEPKLDPKVPFNFTTKRLEDLLPQAQRYEAKDTNTPGLVLRVSPQGVKSFSVFRWVPAKRRPERITLGKFPMLSIDVARKRAQEIIGQIAAGKSPATEKRSMHAEDTFGKVFEAYMESHVRSKLGKKQQVDAQGLYNNYIKPARLDTKRLSDIHLLDLERLHGKVGKQHPRGANKIVALVRAVYNFAEKHGVKVTSPAKGIEMFHVAARERFIQPHEMPGFLKALDETAQPYQDFFRLLLLTGVRLGNMLSAHFEQFDLVNGIWHVPSSSHKNKNPHALPLLPEAIEIVKRRRAEVPNKVKWLWPSDISRSGHITHVETRWASLLARGGFDDLTRHDVRRTVGSWLSINNASMTVVGKALGQTSVQATQVYARLTLDPVRDAMQAAIAKMHR